MELSLLKVIKSVLIDFFQVDKIDIFSELLKFLIEQTRLKETSSVIINDTEQPLSYNE